MEKQKFRPLSWKVKFFDYNANIITDYDVLKHREDFIRKLKKKCANKEEFAEALKREIMWAYWSKCEWELIISVTVDDRVLLKPWIGRKESTELDVTDDESFDWRGFATYYINKQVFKNEAKIDVYDQLTYANQFQKLVTYCWTTRLKYERDSVKFHE